MTRFYLNREQIIDKDSSASYPMASYDTKKKAFEALYALAQILHTTVDYSDDGLNGCGEPAIWSWSVTDMTGAMYSISEEVVDENGDVEIF